MGFSAPYSVLFLNSVLFFISIIFFYFSLKAIYSGYPFFVFFASVLFSSLPVLHYLSRIASPDILLVLLLLVFANFVINNKTGCRFLTVDAYSEAVPFYIKNGFVPLTPEDENSSTRLLFFDLNEKY